MTTRALEQATLPTLQAFRRRTRSGRLSRASAERESAMVRGCLAYLHRLGIPAWRQNSGAMSVDDGRGRARFVRFSVKGVSDILGILPWSGRMLAVECKVQGNHASEEQRAFLEMVNRSGGLGLLIYEVRELVDALAIDAEAIARSDDDREESTL